jgi:hypothetical protein
MTFHDGMFARLDTILDARFAVSYGFETKIDRVYLDPYVTSISDLPFILVPGIGAYPSKRDGLYLVIRIAPASEAPKAAAERYMVLFGDPESEIVWKLIEDMRKEHSTAFRDIDGSLPGARSIPIVLFNESTCGDSTMWARSGSTIHGDGTITIEGDEYRSVSQITIEPLLGSSITR